MALDSILDDLKNLKLKLKDEVKLITEKGEETPLTRNKFTFSSMYEITPMGVLLQFDLIYRKTLLDSMSKEEAEQLTKRYFRGHSNEYPYYQINHIKTAVHKKPRVIQGRKFNFFEAKGILYRVVNNKDKQ